MARLPISFHWLKRLMPRGLYGRAALILILPIVTIQLVVSIAFLQRHFEGVTRQMTTNVAREVRLVLDRIAAAPDAAAAASQLAAIAQPLDLAVGFGGAGAAADSRVVYDLSGVTVIATLRDQLPGVRSVDLSDLREVRLALDSVQGPVEIRFERRRVSASNPHQLLVLMLVTGVLMTLIAVIFLRNQLRPIRRLAHAAEAFGRGRVVPYRPSGALEVRSAGNAFLDMRNRIERHIEQRTLLLSGVSHDLRTPLTRLRLGLSMIEGDAEVPALLRDVDEMQYMLDAFLDFARGDAESEAAAPTDPVTFLRDIAADHRRMGHDVAVVAVEGEGEAMLGRTAVRRAIDNLIGNALQYGSRAELAVTILDRSVRFAVEDDGPGIPRDRRDEALRPFTRLDDARSQNRGGGVGLGLSITADIARAHGGSLRLGDSERLGGLKAELVLAR